MLAQYPPFYPPQTLCTYISLEMQTKLEENNNKNKIPIKNNIKYINKLHKYFKSK